jgi:hypothetical protein
MAHYKYSGKSVKSFSSKLSVQDSERDFFYINADTCELDLQHLSAPALEGGGLVWGGSTVDMVEQFSNPSVYELNSFLQNFS